jgi:BirA family biotin operon repressor/biotin-[acetyl-CoA-carboxylase] ligase
LSSLNPIGIPFIELPSVESTNNYAMGLARAAMAQHGTVVFAHEQTAGKGQRNRQWISEKGMNLAMSAVIEPATLHSGSLFILSMMAAVTVRHLIQQYTGEQIKIKWPNDIYWCDRKAAGILIENLWQGHEWKCAVIGVGVNINQTEFGDLATKAVSLKEITGRHHDPVNMSKELAQMLEQKFQQLLASPQPIIAEYRDNLYRKNEKVKLKKGSRVFEAIIKDVTVNGQLVVQDVLEEQYDVGEIEWMIS